MVSPILAALPALAQSTPNIDPACLDEAAQGAPAGYDEQAQTDFLANHVALSTTLSAIHGPVPHAPGHGAIGLELAGTPPLGCERRLVEGWSKTETPSRGIALPRIRATYAFPQVGPLVPFAGVGYVPPVPIGGATNGVVSAELGVGFEAGPFQAGARFHASSTKRIGEIAPPALQGGPTIEDLYVASTLGLDLSVGMVVSDFVPYVSVGWTDASTYFYVGDADAVRNNYHPYFGPVAALGIDGVIVERLRVGGELYAAPGGYSLPDPNVASNSPVPRYGHLYTARVRIGVEI